MVYSPSPELPDQQPQRLQRCPVGPGLEHADRAVGTESAGICGAPGSGVRSRAPRRSPHHSAVGIPGRFCYLYTLTGTDNVDNSASISATVAVDTTAPTAPGPPGRSHGTEPPYTDAVSTGHCYGYEYHVSDNVGNSVTYGPSSP